MKNVLQGWYWSFSVWFMFIGWSIYHKLNTIIELLRGLQP